MANVEVNRRAEGTSELNRRLGAAGKGAAALECCVLAGDYGRGCAGRQAQRARAAPRGEEWPVPCRKASAMCLFRFTKADNRR